MKRKKIKSIIRKPGKPDLLSMLEVRILSDRVVIIEGNEKIEVSLRAASQLGDFLFWQVRV